ncbi:hypothetical protein E2C01_040960 [Portunus trituberculatus]|uniref:Uncharacterized protein n=1 Tax=Portunus trituberculatus TaxID=210409 RepID=A0A5B7FHY4_PORTR|nr:hypothetical protein [Portunus trituberculatus]
MAVVRASDDGRVHLDAGGDERAPPLATRHQRPEEADKHDEDEHHEAQQRYDHPEAPQQIVDDRMEVARHVHLLQHEHPHLQNDCVGEQVGGTQQRVHVHVVEIAVLFIHLVLQGYVHEEESQAGPAQLQAPQVRRLEHKLQQRDDEDGWQDDRNEVRLLGHKHHLVSVHELLQSLLVGVEEVRGEVGAQELGGELPVVTFLLVENSEVDERVVVLLVEGSLHQHDARVGVHPVSILQGLHASQGHILYV